MKNIKKYFILFFTSVFFVSCDDAIEIIQDGELGNDATFETVGDLNTFLQGSVYTSLGATNEILFTAEFTDEVGIGPNNGGQALQLHRFNFNPADGYASGMWIGHYTVINRVNRLLFAAETITPDPEATVSIDVDGDGNLDEISEEVYYDTILAQARAIRAYAYFQLLSYYSTDLSDDGALGVMLFEDVPEITRRLPRSTNGEVFELIERDLLFAENNLLEITAPNIYKFVTPSLINSIRARMYLYRKNYPLAKQYANDVISNSGLVLTPATPYAPANFYTSTTNNPYRRIWADLAQGEVIFALSRPIAGAWGNIASGFFFNNTSATGGAFLDMGRNLYNELVSVPGDIRALAFVDPTSLVDPNYLTNPAYNTSDVLVIDKYPGKPSQQSLRNDIKIFRLSEMYFILAECAVNDGQLDVAAGYIKNIRDARNRLGPQPLPTYANATAAWADILLERRKELCFEGHRYIDIKRLGVLANASIDRNVTDDLILTLPLTIPNTDYRFTFPIPQDEIAGNPTIRTQQNPGYAN